MNKLNFCKSFIHLGHGLISFERRPYLPAIYRSTADNLVLRCSRQTEKSTFLGNTILFEACMNPGIQMLFVSPRFEQAQSFVHVRVIRALAQSPLVRRRLLGRPGRNPKIMHLQFVNGSSLFVRAAYQSGDACRGYMRSDYVLQVLRWERFAATEDPQWVVQAVAEICNRFQVKLIAADSGNGHVVNRMLVDKLSVRGLCAIIYSASDHEPRRDGVLIKWTVNRTASIGVLFSRIKMQKILFPRKEVCGSLLDEFACETAEYDSTMRTIQYVHPESQQDDALHSTNYALLFATWVHAKTTWAF